MKHFVKLSINGSFPSGVDEVGTYEVSEIMHKAISDYIEGCIKIGEARRI